MGVCMPTAAMLCWAPHHFNIFPDDIRTGATFVHDVFAAAVVVVAAGHLALGWSPVGTCPWQWPATRNPTFRLGQRAPHHRGPEAAVGIGAASGQLL
jgi:hypothetical protein